MDPLRRAALLTTAITLPVVIALVVLVNVLGDPSGGDPAAGPAEIDGAAPVRPEDLPVLRLDVPEVTPEAEAACPAVMGTLPLELAGEPSRRVQSDTPYVYAWGDPAVVLTCGVDRPEGWVVTASAIQINGVQWHVDTSDPATTVWTAVDRPVHVEVRLPAGVDSAPVTALTVPLAEALPYQEPQPAP
ncbi:DUF3515 domain-containing protein [Blastococcus saxobsidens]|uniref:Uncharacterized protein DUF3515 n=1 Tax=Blastococcus saxobsidens TaxID=138336 RepID=A0A4Q7Y8W8_9ACTN|nr:DUF3515 domain-containing protein [Blastococcus saxobsidens]RZU32763.1 uncharacterized protein DUF3515 [Blastococcus saxobsidens]